MRNINEIKKDRRLRFDSRFKPPVMSGIVLLSTGKKASFMFSVAENAEHVSMQIVDRLPRWGEMCELKDIFFDDEEEVIQIHPKKSEYVDLTDALHLWRPADGDWNRLMNGGRA